MLPEHLELVCYFNSDPALALTLLASSGKDVPLLVEPLLPYFSLPTLLFLVTHHETASLFPSDPHAKAAKLSNLMDLQRDWIASGSCPPEMKDECLVDGRLWWKGWQGLERLEGGRSFRNGRAQGVEEVGRCGATGRGALQGRRRVQEHPELHYWWSNVVLGGGSVLSILTDQAESDAYSESDFDLFLYNLAPHELVPKVKSIIEQLKATLPKPERNAYDEWPGDQSTELLIVKGFNALTLVPKYRKDLPRPVIQVILASNPCVASSLTDFDLDVCCVAFTGTKVIALPRSCRAVALGVNLFDPAVARRRDPTANTVSSRIIKYQARGFGSALPPLIVAAFKDNGEDLSKLISNDKNKAKSDKTPPEGKEQAMDWDYGPPSQIAFWKTVNPANGDSVDLFYDLWDHNVQLARAFVDLVFSDPSIMPSKVPGKAEIPTLYGQLFREPYLNSWNLPTIASLDLDRVPGIKQGGITGKDTWTDLIPHLSNIQYITKLPRSITALAKTAEESLAARLTVTSTGGPKKKSKPTATQSTLDDEQQEKVTEALETLSDVPAPTSAFDLLHPKPTSELPDVATQDALVDPYYRWGAKHSGSLLAPLLGKSGKEEGTTKKASPFIYQVVPFAGLLQFSGLDPNIDRFRDFIWRAWGVTARAAVSIPKEPRFDLEDVNPRTRAAWNSQPSLKEVLARMDADLLSLGKEFKKVASAEEPVGEVGELDEREEEVGSAVGSQQGDGVGRVACSESGGLECACDLCLISKLSGAWKFPLFLS